MRFTILEQFYFRNNEDCSSVVSIIIKHMEESIKKGFFSRSCLTYYSKWKPDYTILIFQEILEQRLTINNVKFPIIEDFTLVGNNQVKFTITSEFFDFYLTNTAI